MRVVGLTGGIGSGKSTVAHMFEDLGIPVYYADHAAKDLMNTSPWLKDRILSIFGDEAYENDALNRKYIAEIVFQDKRKLDMLNKLVHPAVRKDFDNWISRQKAPYVIQENPLIFEKGQMDWFDTVITVIAPQEIKIKRVMKRDNLTESQVLDRMRNQWDDKAKKKGSDFVIDNKNLENTRLQVNEIHHQLL